VNVIAVATPLPLLALPLLFAKRWTRDTSATADPELASPRNRLFVACFVFIPLLVFCWSSLKHAPRLNWTGPIWLATVPLLGWALLHADTLRWRHAAAARRWIGRFLAALLVLYPVFLYYVALGIPALSYPDSFARAMGWATAAQQLHLVHDGLAQKTGAAPVVVGMDKYFIAAQLSYNTATAERGPMRVTSKGAVFGGNGLMFEFWDAPEEFVGRTFIMVSRHKSALESQWLAAHFHALDSNMHALPTLHDGAGANGRLVDHFYYRVGYGYRLPLELSGAAPTSTSQAVRRPTSHRARQR
jgi:dolichol-phosphate mannosyltransferase